MNAPQCSVVSLTDTELTGLVRCARRRLVVIAPGLSELVAKALVETWRELGPQAVQVVLDPDPEVCRLGLGDLASLKLLHETAEQMGTRIHQQQGLRIGVVITKETTAIFSPTPLLIEAGGKPGEKTNAIRLESPVLDPANNGSHSSLGELSDAFGSSESLFQEMKVRAVFKGVTYESLSDPEFMRIAGEEIPSLDSLHDEFDAAKAEQAKLI